MIPLQQMQGRRNIRVVLWVVLAISVAWCGYIFYAYRDGPYVSFGKALVDSTPFFLLAASAAALLKLSTRE
jgi:hypothetical protein